MKGAGFLAKTLAPVVLLLLSAACGFLEQNPPPNIPATIVAEGATVVAEGATVAAEAAAEARVAVATVVALVTPEPRPPALVPWRHLCPLRPRPRLHHRRNPLHPHRLHSSPERTAAKPSSLLWAARSTSSLPDSMTTRCDLNNSVWPSTKRSACWALVIRHQLRRWNW